MNQDLHNARELLATGNYTCVLCRDSHTVTCTTRGVRPLVDLLREGTLPGYSAADKVVGKATAFLYVLLGVKAVYAPVMSRPAVEVLRTHGIEAIPDAEVEAIFNRDRSGFCPMETAVRHIEESAPALEAILKTMKTGIHRS